MASVSPLRFRLCTGCKAAKRTRPAPKCRGCKITAYRVYWRADGVKRSEVIDGANVANPRKAADARKAEIEAALHLGTYVDPHGAKTLFMDYADEWAAAQDWKQSSRDMWPTRRKLLAAYVGERTTLGKVDRLKLLAIRKQLAERYARSYVAGNMHLIKAILRTAAASGRIPRDPTVGVSATPKRRADDTTGRVTPDMVPTAAEALAILAAAPQQYRAAVALGIAGLRLGEVLGMEADRIDLDAGTVTVTHQATEHVGKGVVLATPKAEKSRTIVVPALVATELRRHLRAGYGGTWTDAKGHEHRMLFVHNAKLLSKGVFYDQAWTPALRDAKLTGRFTFHGLRHHCASQLLSAGAPMPAVAGYLGHHLHTLTRVYAHWLRDDATVPADVLNRLFSDTGTDDDEGEGEAPTGAPTGPTGHPNTPNAPQMPLAVSAAGR